MKPVSERTHESRRPPDIADPSIPGFSHPSGPAWRRVFLILLLAMAAAAAAYQCGARAWRATALREALIPQLQEMDRRDPYNPAVLGALGTRLAQSARYAEAAGVLGRLVTTGNLDEPVWLGWAAATAAAGDSARARAIVRLGVHGNVPGLHQADMRCRLVGGGASNVALAQIISPEGTRPLAALWTTGSFLNPVSEWWGRRHPDWSGFATREARARDQPRNAQAQRLWGEALMANEAFAPAMQVLQRALLLAPRSLRTHLAMAQLLMAEGLENKAGLEYEKCLKLQPGCLQALLGLGQAALDHRLIQMADDVYERATKRAPGSAEAWIGLGRAYLEHGLKFKESLEAFRKAYQLDPGRTDYYVDYSKALGANYRWDEAEGILRERLRAAPEDAPAHFEMAMLLIDHRPGAARDAEAEANLEIAARLSPHWPRAEAQLGRLLLRDNKTARAVTVLEDAADRDPFNLLAATFLAQAYARAGRSADARAAALKAGDLSAYSQKVSFLVDQEHRSPLDAGVHAQLAALYAGSHQMELARQESQMALILRTRTAGARRAIQAFSRASNSGQPAVSEASGAPDRPPVAR